MLSKGVDSDREKSKGERTTLKKWGFCVVTIPALPLTLGYLQYFHDVSINFLGLYGGRELMKCPGLCLAHNTRYSCL